MDPQNVELLIRTGTAQTDVTNIYTHVDARVSDLINNIKIRLHPLLENVALTKILLYKPLEKEPVLPAMRVRDIISGIDLRTDPEFSISFPAPVAGPATSSAGPGNTNDGQPEYEPWIKAFEAPFVSGPVDPVKCLLAQLEERAAMSNGPLSVYAPCTALVQGSCWGKSRTLNEIGKQRPVLYCSFTEPEGRSFPRATTNLLAHFKDVNEDTIQRRFYHLLYTTVSLAKSCVEGESINCARFNEAQSQPQFWESALSTSPTSNRQMIVDVSKTIPYEESPFRMLIIFDEARSLSRWRAKDSQKRSIFHTMECEMQKFREFFFFLCVDTTSTVVDFTPHAGLHPSDRVMDGTLRLLPPICILPTRDIGSGSEVAKKTNPTLIQYLCRFGRPVWSAMIYAGQNDDDVIEFARRKLTRSPPGKNLEVNQSLAIAVASCRIVLNIAPSSHLASDLVSGYMGTCVGISEDRDMVYAMYPSDPILSEAAALVFDQHSTEIIQQIHGLISSGTIGAGYRGEIVAQLILTLARDRTQNSSVLSHPVCLSDFLSQFVDKISVASKLIDRPRQLESYDDAIENSEINFTHFSMVNHTPDLAEMKEFFNRCTAILCKPGQEHVDIIIPTRYTKGGVEVYSSLNIQIKCLKESDANFPNSATSYLRQETIFHESLNYPYVTLYMQVGQAQGAVTGFSIPDPITAKRARESNTCATHLSFISLDSIKFLQDDRLSSIKNLLQQLTVARFDPIRYHPENLQDAVRILTGLR